MDGINPAARGKTALERSLAALVRRHRQLDARIEREARLAGSTGVAHLKRLRLALKDRIAALRRGRQMA